MLKPLYRVYYSEAVEYEDYVEADSPEEAKKQFLTTLHTGILEPIAIELGEFEAEECIKANH